MGGCRTTLDGADDGSTTPPSVSSHNTGSGARPPNDFNRKDLFTQHCRRMHAPWGSRDPSSVPKREREAFEADMEGVRARCWRVRRRAPGHVGCGVCGEVFGEKEKAVKERKSAARERDREGKAWEERMEHVGRHYEREEGVVDREKVDVGLRDWAVKEGLVRKGRTGGYWLLGLEPVGERVGVERGRGRGGRRGRRGMVAEVEDEEEDDEAEAQEEEDVDAEAEVDLDVDAEAEDEDREEDQVDDDDDDDTDAEGEDE